MVTPACPREVTYTVSHTLHENNNKKNEKQISSSFFVIFLIFTISIVFPVIKQIMALFAFYSHTAESYPTGHTQFNLYTVIKIFPRFIWIMSTHLCPRCVFLAIHNCITFLTQNLVFGVLFKYLPPKGHF